MHLKEIIKQLETIASPSLAEDFDNSRIGLVMDRGNEIRKIAVALTLSINIDLPDEFSKVSSEDEIDLGRKFDKANALLSTCWNRTSG